MKRVALSFSGGKDSCLALYYLLRENFEVVSLFTTVWKDNQKTVAHEEELSRLQVQAKQLGIPITFIETDFESYGKDFIKTLKELKETKEINMVAFGDIYIEGHREWGERMAEEAGLKPYYPLWTSRDQAAAMLKDLVNAGFQAEVIKIDNEKLPANWLGRLLDDSFIKDILQYEEICPMGESGEYHTYVYDGPIFNKRVNESFGSTR